MKDNRNDKINEATHSFHSRGSYNPPLRPGLRKFLDNSNDPFYEPTSNYINAENHYDSLDGKMSKNNKNIKKKESVSKKIRNKDWNIEVGEEGDDEYAKAPYKKVKHKVKKHKGAEDISENKKPNSFEEWLDNNKEVLYEDLAVWFGTKKKPKGSKQPKGPWVNICRKDKNGKHPPCGRPEASDKAYPKCRAAGVAGKMSDSEKRSACQQKRRAEKSNPKSGTGNKPKLVSYKPRNENMIKITESQLERLVLMLKEQGAPSSKPMYYFGNIGIKPKGNDYYAFKGDKSKTDLGVLSKESELGYVVQDDRVVFNEKTVSANLLAKKENSQNTDKVIYLGNDNIPYIANISFGTMNSQIAQELIKKGTYSESSGKEIKVKQFLVKNGKYYTPLLKDTQKANNA